MFFSKKKIKCKGCDEEIKSNWNFCPYCGKRLTERPESIFDDIDKEFEKVDSMLSFKPIKGISIMIGGGMEPKIEVEKFGHKRLETKPVEKVKEKPVKIAKVTEEPETNVERFGNRQVINLKLPGVKLEDIEIKRMEQSIEVRAFAGDKAYFKLIPIPSNASVNRSFEDNLLKIEVQR